MPRRKEPRIPDAVLDQLLAGADPRTALEPNGLLDDLKKALAERVLNAEMDHHLAGEEPGNWRNGYGKKTVITDTGRIELAVPRDRQASFDPQLIAKYQRRFPGFDDKIIAMYARGMSTREIVGHLRDLYGIEVSPDLISAITDAVLEEVATWQARPLETVYPLIFFDALRVKIRDEGLVRNKVEIAGHHVVEPQELDVRIDLHRDPGAARPGKLRAAGNRDVGKRPVTARRHATMPLLCRGHHPQLFRRRQDRHPLDGRRRPAVDTDERLSDQRDPVQLAIEIGLEDVGRRQVRGRAVVPERDVAGIPLETDRVFRPRYVLPDQFEQLLAFPWCQPDDRLDVGGAREQHALAGLGVHRHERVLAGQRAALDALVVLLPGLGVRTRDVGVNGAQGVDKAAQRPRQPLIGGNEVGPERVAAIGRDRHATQDRGEG